jgi:subtilase family serine protease
MLRFGSSRHAIAAALLPSASTAILALPAAAEVPKFIGAVSASEKADFDLYFPIRNRATLEALVEAQNRKGAPEYHNWLTPQQFAQRFGPAPATVAGVTAELAARGLTVTAHQGLMLHVTGSAAAVQAAFGVHLSHARFAGGFETLVADRALVMPPVLAASGAGTPQFTTLAPARKHSYLKPYLGAVRQNSSRSTGPYLTADLRQAYDFPSALALTASRVTIGIPDAGDFLASDMTTYFGGTYPVQDGLPASLTPNVLPAIPINGPGTPFSVANSGETELDIQQAGGIFFRKTMAGRPWCLSDALFLQNVPGHHLRRRQRRQWLEPAGPDPKGVSADAQRRVSAERPVRHQFGDPVVRGAEL